ncbi:MAG: hypothetical protein QOH61_623 [Chloroflexota bacterium]|nr:hypothetical protein [Chloroflexota bacterium]
MPFARRARRSPCATEPISLEPETLHGRAPGCWHGPRGRSTEEAGSDDGHRPLNGRVRLEATVHEDPDHVAELKARTIE